MWLMASVQILRSMYPKYFVAESATRPARARRICTIGTRRVGKPKLGMPALPCPVVSALLSGWVPEFSYSQERKYVIPPSNEQGSLKVSCNLSVDTERTVNNTVGQ